MERLTKHSKQTSHENGICCTHFYGPECLEVGGNCAMNCKWEEAAWSRLAAYEDTELTPEEVSWLIKDWLRLCTTIRECGGIDRLRVLDEADKEGRVVVLPCKVGNAVWVRVHKIDPISGYRCSKCRRMVGFDLTPYCPNCGAKMDGGDNDAAD